MSEVKRPVGSSYPLRTLVRAIVVLTVPVLVLALVGGQVSTALLYAFLVVDGIALSWLTLSESNSANKGPMRVRNNNEIESGYSRTGSRVETLTAEIHLATKSSKYSADSARRNLARVLANILPVASRGVESSTAGVVDLGTSSFTPDLQELLSYDKGRFQDTDEDSEPSRNLAGNRRGTPVQGRMTGRISRSKEPNYLLLLERVISTLEKEYPTNSRLIPQTATLTPGEVPLHDL